MRSRKLLSGIVLVSVLAALGVFGAGCGGGGGGGGRAAMTFFVDDSNPVPPGTGAIADPFTTIAAALAVPPRAGDTIAVAGGVYAEAIVMRGGVDILGGYDAAFTARDPAANVTTIDATGTGMSAVVGANNAILDGFTITGGNSGGVTLDSVNTTVTNNIITGNATFGVDVYGGGAPTIMDNEISGNAYSGVSIYADPSAASNATISNNIIHDNLESGVYFYAYNAADTTPAAHSLTIGNNNIYGNTLEGVQLLNIPLFDTSSNVDSTISNNTIRNNAMSGILEYSYGYDTGLLGAAGGVTSCLLTNNLIDANMGAGLTGVAFAGYLGDPQEMLVSNTLLNNLVNGNLFDGVYTYGYGGSLDAGPLLPVDSTNDVFAGNNGYGVYSYAYTPDGVGPPAMPVTIANSIIGQNTIGDALAYIVPYGYPGVDVTYSNVEYGYPGVGNISADPLFENAPADVDWASGDGTTTTVVVLDETLYTVGDVIEINGDDVDRTVTVVAAGLITFTPALGIPSTTGSSIKNFGAAGSTAEDYNLGVGSPSIDAGNPDPAFNDTDATRNDQGVYGGPMGGDPGAL